MNTRTVNQLFTATASPEYCPDKSDTPNWSGSKNDMPGSGGRLDSPPPLPPPPPPSRATSIPPVEYPSPLGTMYSRDLWLAASYIPRSFPELGSTGVFSGSTSFIRNSGIRRTLPSVKRLECQRPACQPLAEVTVDIPGRRLPGVSPSKKQKPELLNMARGLDSRPGKYINENEKDAAIALLFLKDCSSEILNMARNWSKISNIPLCDFIVVQRKCQAMLERIETLKDIKIQTREATAVDNDSYDAYQTEKVTIKKRKSIDLYRARSKALSSRSSSIVSIVNASNGEEEKAPESENRRTGRALTRSPTSSECLTPSLLQPSTTFITGGNHKQSGVFLSSKFADEGKILLCKVGKSSKSGKNRNAHMKCLHCFATDTPEWRKGPVGPTTLCNACGLFYKKLIKKFGTDTAHLIMRSRQAENPQDRKVPRSSVLLKGQAKTDTKPG